jgi:hypothetical protein
VISKISEPFRERSLSFAAVSGKKAGSIERNVFPPFFPAFDSLNEMH